MIAEKLARYRMPVPPREAGVDRPRWSVMIPTYNCAQFLADTLRGVLAQDPGSDHMQIEVVDDCSNDDPQTIVREVGKGRVGFHRQTRNVGHIENFHTCITRSRGEIVHLLHGDDVVGPSFYERLGRGFDIHPGAGAAFCRPLFIDAQGVQVSAARPMQQLAGLITDAAVRLAREQEIMTPCIVVRRAVYEELGGFDLRLKCSEDWEMWVRIAARFPVWYDPEPLASYRMHSHSNTGRHLLSAGDMAYTRMAIEIFEDYLPAGVGRGVAASARRKYALRALEMAGRLLAERQWSGCAAQIREAFRLDPSLLTLVRALQLAAKQRGVNARAR